ncbi:(2Fe-2S)-binding protein [Neisseria perflava]|uniref:(2Fe-2S)-binding protein n=1 Tax=Neisseria perflava TaxID=33053 RepID=UPI00209D8266|nr:(2Fe-2S)-binding protein [Neisseria perflava]MCP1660402.1 siderophore ferric iron reductase [Neisseria perflava]
MFVGVWAASVKQVCLDFSGFQHRMGEVFTESFTLAEQPVVVRPSEKIVFQTASHLKTWALRELHLIQVHYPLSEKLALYFLGDSVLKALAAAHRVGLLGRVQTEDLAAQWQQALALRCNGRLMWQNDAQEFLVEMVGCCQHFRRKDADYCAGCPKTRKKCGCMPSEKI